MGYKKKKKEKTKNKRKRREGEKKKSGKIYLILQYVSIVQFPHDPPHPSSPQKAKLQFGAHPTVVA